MSEAQISDVELDRLLGEIPAPPPPATDLADRIAARAVRTPQERPIRSVFAPRHGPRRRATVWTAVVAANLMAAAAVAACWDGQRFDLQRLADLPHRVAAAVHVGQHHRGKVPIAPRKEGTLPHVAPPVRVAAAPKVEPPRAQAPILHARAVPLTPMQVRPHLANHPIETMHSIDSRHSIERQTAAVPLGNRLRPYRHRVAVPPHSIARVEPHERDLPESAAAKRLLPPAPEPSTRQQQMAPEVTVSQRPPAPGVQRREARTEAEARNDEYTLRLRRWRNQFAKREHARERASRFRRRF